MDFDTVIIGAGVVGLAVAAERARSSRNLLVIERRATFGQETSSHNSEVLHAGLYYPTGSWKARLCLEGNALLRGLAEIHGIPLNLCGKLVVGDADEAPALEALLARATANGVRGPRLLSTAELRALEPRVSATHALLSPTTGIIDSHALMRYYLFEAGSREVSIAYRTEVVGIASIPGGYRLEARGPDGQIVTVDTARVVNAAGLEADRIAALAGIDVDAAGYRLHRCKGDYFSTRPRCRGLVSRLIYPVPGTNAAGLGIHVTLDLAGRMRLGPDVRYLEPGEASSYAADPGRRVLFAAAVRRYLPEVTEDDLEPEFAGIRPKLQGPGEPVRDFVIVEESGRGLPGFVNLIGIESPGLTASPAIAREVGRLLGRD